MWEVILALLKIVRDFLWLPLTDFRRHMAQVEPLCHRTVRVEITNTVWSLAGWYRYRLQPLRPPIRKEQPTRLPFRVPAEKPIPPPQTKEPVRERLVIRSPSVGFFKFLRLPDGTIWQPTGVIEKNAVVGTLDSMGLYRDIRPEVLWYVCESKGKRSYTECHRFEAYCVLRTLIADGLPAEWGQELFEVTLVYRVKALSATVRPASGHPSRSGIF